jgi:hypothetical protein
MDPPNKHLNQRTEGSVNRIGRAANVRRLSLDLDRGGALGFRNLDTASMFTRPSRYLVNRMYDNGDVLLLF